MATAEAPVPCSSLVLLCHIVPLTGLGILSTRIKIIHFCFVKCDYDQAPGYTYPPPYHHTTSQTSEHCLYPSNGKRNLHKAGDLCFSSRAQRVKSLSLPPPSFCLWPLDQPWLPMRTHRNTTRLGLSGRKPARPEFCCSKDFFLNFILLLRKEARACASLQEC